MYKRCKTTRRFSTTTSVVFMYIYIYLFVRNLKTTIQSYRIKFSFGTKFNNYVIMFLLNLCINVKHRATKLKI